MKKGLSFVGKICLAALSLLIITAVVTTGIGVTKVKKAYYDSFEEESLKNYLTLYPTSGKATGQLAKMESC